MVNFDYALKIGQVLKVCYPDDKDYNKTSRVKFNAPTYDVVVMGKYNIPVLVRDCVLATSLSGDNYSLTTLTPSKPDEQEPHLAFTERSGSIVLLLYLKGDKEMPVIIGTLPHPGKDLGIKRELDSFYSFEYQGVYVSINKDGELDVKILGPLDENGNRKFKEDNAPTVTINNDGELTIDGTKINLGREAADSIIKGSTYREEEKALHDKLGIILQNIAISMTAASAAAAAVPMTATLAAPLNNVALELNKAIVEIKKFEAKANTYLSEKVFTE